jgi:hypothetical protein
MMKKLVVVPASTALAIDHRRRAKCSPERVTTERATGKQRPELRQVLCRDGERHVYVWAAISTAHDGHGLQLGKIARYQSHTFKHFRERKFRRSLKVELENEISHRAIPAV